MAKRTATRPATRSRAASKRTAKAKAGAAAGKGSTTLSSQLGDLANAWGDAEARTGFEQLPDGDYQFRIEDATIEASKTSQRLQINWALQVVAPEEFVGKNHHKYDGLNTEDALAWTKGNLETLGMEIPGDIDELPAALTECKGIIVGTTLLTKNDIQNTYFNEVVEELEEAPEAAEEVAEEEAAEEVDLEEGATVEVELDGTPYRGTATEVGEEASTITFDDGDVMEIPNGDILILTDE